MRACAGPTGSILRQSTGHDQAAQSTTHDNIVVRRDISRREQSICLIFLPPDIGSSRGKGKRGPCQEDCESGPDP